MSVKAPLLTILLLACSLTALQCQTIVDVSEPDLSLKNGKVQIDYKLLNSRSSDLFTIHVEISTGSGLILEAKNLTGDVGEHIGGGSSKRIVWDIEADSIFLDEDIFVQIFALPEAVPVIAEIQKVEETKNPEEKHERSEVKDDGSRLMRKSLILKSVALPGLGLTGLTGNAHWIKGAAAYGCLAGSVYFNRISYKTYQDYLEPESPENALEMFDEASSQKKTSQILGYTALGIWITDLIWTIVRTNDMSQQAAKNQKGISIETSVEPISKIPLLALSYRF